MALARFYAEASAAARSRRPLTPNQAEGPDHPESSQGVRRHGHAQRPTGRTAPGKHSGRPHIRRQAGRLACAPQTTASVVCTADRGGAQAPRRDSRSGPGSHRTPGAHFPPVWDTLLTHWLLCCRCWPGSAISPRSLHSARPSQATEGPSPVS